MKPLLVFIVRWLRVMRLYEHCQASILEPSVGVADVKITMGDHVGKGVLEPLVCVADVKITMNFHDIKQLDSKERRRRYELTQDIVLMIDMEVFGMLCLVYVQTLVWKSKC